MKATYSKEIRMKDFSIAFKSNLTALLLLLMMIIPQTQGQGSETTDQAALLAMKAQWTSFNGLTTGWTAATLPCAGSWLNLNSRSIVGRIASETGQLNQLMALLMYGNQLTGSIPSELGRLTRLTHLFLSNNQLAGTLSTHLGSMRSLIDLWMSTDRLSGAIPSEMGSLTNLTDLTLWDNRLSGSIPSQLGLLIRLQSLTLHLNRLTDRIPSQLGALTKLVSLHLYSNKLSGPIPSQLSALTLLTYYYLQNNYLSGTIPSQVESQCAAITESRKAFQCNLFVSPTTSACMFNTQAACASCPTGSSPAASNTPRGQCTQVATCPSSALTLPSNVASAGTCVGNVPSGSTCSQSCFNGGNYTYFCRLGILVNASRFPRCNGSIPICSRSVDTSSTISSSQCPTFIQNNTACTPICASGYTANASLTRTCIDGNLTASLGSCNPDPCIVPSNTPSTLFSSCLVSTPSGSSCTPTCNNGYTASGSLERNCFAGAFSAAVGSCLPKSCLPPANNANITFASCTPNVASGSTCTPGCNLGYTATASLVMTCSLGNYSSPLGFCAANPCTPPSGTVSTDYSSCLSSTPSSSTCSPSCNPGYSPTPTTDISITCIAGSFQPSASTCQPSPCSTPSVSFPNTTGNCIGPIASGATCSLGCAFGYIANGSLAFSCSFGELSSVGNGYCGINSDFSCSQPTPPFPLTVGDCSLNTPDGATCMLGCVSGYTPLSTPIGDFTATCSNQTFSWDVNRTLCDPNPCTAADLSLPSSMTLGSCSSETQSGDSCDLSCLSGHIQVNSLRITCFAGSFSSYSGSCIPRPCDQPILSSSSAKTSIACVGQTASGQVCQLQCINGFTPIGSMTMTCNLGNFTFDGIGYCVTIEDVQTSATSLKLNPPLLISPNTKLNITLSSFGHPPSDLVVTNFTVDGVFADANFAVPSLALQNQTVPLVVYVTWPAIGEVPLVGFVATVILIQGAELISVCPDRILAQVPQSVVIQGVGFFPSSSLKCILNGTAAFPAVLNNPTTVGCDLTWLDTTPNQVVYLNVANDGSIDAFFSQPSLEVTIKGACEREKLGSIVTSNGCQCPSGTADTGASCVPCEDGFYQDEIGKTSCKSCGPGRDTNGNTRSDSFEDCKCAALYFPDDFSNECRFCPIGMSCPGNNVVIILPGFWRASSTSSDVVSCSSESCDSLTSTRSTHNVGSGTGQFRCIGSNASTTLCSDGYTGPLCAVCAKGYAKLGSSIDPSQITCIECPNSNLNILALAVLIFFAILLAYALIHSATYQGDLIQARSTESKAQLLRQDSLSVIFKVLLNYLQVLYYLGRLAANWSDLATRFFNAIGIIGAMSPSNYTLQCAANWRFYDTLVFVFFSPLVVILIITIGYLFRHFVKALDPQQSKIDYQLAVMVLLYQIHPTVMLEVLTSFPCIEVAGTGTRYLKRDMSVDCKSSEYAFYATISALFLVFYIGGMVVVVLLRLRKNYETGRFDSPSRSAYQKYAFFFLGYDMKAYFWEAVIMLRKMGIVAFSVLAAPMLQLLFGIVIITIALIANLFFNPFASPFINRIETLSLIALYVTIILGFLSLYSCGRDDTTWIAVLIILINTGAVAFILISTFQRIQDRISELIFNIPDFRKSTRQDKTEMATISERI